MATETLAVTGVGASDDWTRTGGTDKPNAVSTNDGDTSYLQGNLALHPDQILTFADPSAVKAGDSITNVTVSVVAKKTGPGTGGFTFTCDDGGGATTRTVNNVEFTGSYVQFDNSNDTAPSGGAWTLAKLNALTTHMAQTQSQDTRATQVFATVTYTPAPVSTAHGNDISLGIGL